MNKIALRGAKAVLSLAALAAFTASHADFAISNENFAIGIDDSISFGNMISVFDGIGGFLNTGGPHDFWYDGFDGFAQTSVTVRNEFGGASQTRLNGQGWFAGPVITQQTSTGVDSAIIEGQPIVNVFVRRIIRIDAGTKVAVVTDSIRNATGAIINPGMLDNVNAISPFSPNTFNDVSGVLGLADFASATVAPGNNLTVGFGSPSAAFKFSAGGGQGVTNPFAAVVIDPNGALSDGTLQTISNFGNILPGVEATHTWYIAFGSTKSEASTNYMLATGVSLFGIGPVGPQFVDEHAPLSVSVPATNPGGPLTWTVDGPPGMTIDSNGVISWTPGELDGGNVYPVEVEANNGTTTATTSFNVNVIETNTAPEISAISDVTVDEGTVANADADATDSDIPVQGLTFMLVSGPSGATVNPTSGQFSWPTDENDGPGTYPVTIRVRDDGPGLLSDETSFNVIVEEVNQAPTLNPIANQSTSVGATVNVTASATDPDLPANELTFSLEPGAPAGATIDPSTGEFSWTPGLGTVGDHVVTVRVTDDGEPAMSDTEDFTVTVTAPVLTATYMGDHSGEYSDPTTLKIRITDDQDNPIPGLNLTFTLGTYVGSNTTNSNGVAMVTPILNQPAGNPGVTISFAGNGTFEPFERTEAYEILREKVIVSYYGDQMLQTGTNLLFNTTVRLYATAHQENDGNLGDFSNAKLRYEAFVLGNPGPTPDVVAGPAPIDPTGRSVFFKSLEVDTYNVDIVMAPNDYWRVAPDVQFMLDIKLGTLRDVTGSGWVPFGFGNGHGSFNFKATYVQKKANAKMTFDFVAGDGSKYVVEMTDLMEGGLILGVGADAWKSAFTGVARVRKTSMMGQTTTFTDVPFTVDAWDGGRANPIRPDEFGIILLGPDGLVWIETPDILKVGGGNIKIN